MRTYQKQFVNLLAKEEHNLAKAKYLEITAEQGSNLRKKAQETIREIVGRKQAIITCQIMGIEEI